MHFILYYKIYLVNFNNSNHYFLVGRLKYIHGGMRDSLRNWPEDARQDGYERLLNF